MNPPLAGLFLKTLAEGDSEILHFEFCILIFIGSGQYHLADLADKTIYCVRSAVEQGILLAIDMFEFLFGIDRTLRLEGRRDRFKLIFFTPAPAPVRTDSLCADGRTPESLLSTCFSPLTPVSPFSHQLV